MSVHCTQREDGVALQLEGALTIMDAAALRGGRFAEKIYMGNLSGNDLVRFLESEFASMKKVRFASDLNVRSYATLLTRDQISPVLLSSAR